MKRKCLLYFLNINTDFFIVIIHKLFVAFFINFMYQNMKLDFFFWNSFFSWLVSLILSVFLSFFHNLFCLFLHLHLSFCFFKRELNLRVFEWMRRWSSWKISFFKNEITADIQILVVVNSSFSFRWALPGSVQHSWAGWKKGHSYKNYIHFWDFLREGGSKILVIS